MIGEPFALAAVQLTCACLLPGLAATLVGAAGAPDAFGVTEFDGDDTGPEPFAFTAWTVNV